MCVHVRARAGIPRHTKRGNRPASRATRCAPGAMDAYPVFLHTQSNFIHPLSGFLHASVPASSLSASWVTRSSASRDKIFLFCLLCHNKNDKSKKKKTTHWTLAIAKPIIASLVRPQRLKLWDFRHLVQMDRIGHISQRKSAGRHTEAAIP